MFSKKQRLSSVQFTQLFSLGKKHHTDTFFVVFQKDNNTLVLPAFAVVVPKKIAKLAVSRNRIRRQMYGHIKNTHSKTGGSYIVVVKKLPISYPDLDTYFSK